MKDVYRNTPYRGYEMEWVYTSSHIAQTGVRLEGCLIRTFLSVEAARKWIEEKTKPLKC